MKMKKKRKKRKGTLTPTHNSQFGHVTVVVNFRMSVAVHERVQQIGMYVLSPPPSMRATSRHVGRHLCNMKRVRDASVDSNQIRHVRRRDDRRERDELDEENV